MASKSSKRNWGTRTFRESMLSKIEETIQLPGVQATKSSKELEDDAYKKAKSRQEYLLKLLEMQLEFYHMAREYLEQREIPAFPEAQIPEDRAAEPLEQAALPSDTINERIQDLINAIENWIL